MTDTLANAAPLQAPEGTVAPAPNANGVAPTVPAQPTSNGTAQEQSNGPDSQEGKSAPSGIVFTDEQINYYASQGIKDLSPDSIIAAHKELRAKKEPQSTAADALAEITGQPAPVPAPAAPLPLAQPATPVAPLPELPQPVNTNQSQPSNELPSDKDIFLFGNSLAQSYPDLKDEINSGKLFKDMNELGISPVSNGDFNLSAVQKFAELRTNQVGMQKQIDEANTPKPESVPGVKYEVDHNQPRVDTLTQQSAQNIVVFSGKQERMGKPVHPQLAEAQQFLKTQRPL